MRFLAYTLLLLIALGTAASAQTFDRDIRMNDGPPNVKATAPQVRVAPSGTVYLSWTDNRTNNQAQVYLASSTDGGRTFAPGRPLTNAGGIQAGMQRGAQFAVDVLGNIHFVWQQLNAQSKISAQYARSTDGGATFSHPIAVAADGGLYNQDFPSIAVDSSGNVYIAWIDDREVPISDHTQLYFARSLDGGVTFQAPIRAGTMPDSGGSCECCNTSIAVSPGGNVYASFRSNIDNNRDIWIARSLDRGSTFTVHKAASESWLINACPMTGSSIVVDRNETAHVTWRDSRPSSAGKDYIYYATLRKNEATCAPDKRISDSPRRSNYPSLAIGNDGMIFCVFQDNRNDLADVYYVSSVDGGFTFSAGRKLSHETGTSRQEVPSADIAADGTVIVAWQDSQRDAGDIVMAISEPPQNVSVPHESDGTEIEARIIESNGSTELVFSTVRSTDVNVSLVDVLGNVVAILSDGFLDPGEHRVGLNGFDVPSGMYSCVVRSGTEQSATRVVITD